ncbi:hypothetical protein ACOME3_001844 [Neoechinorhynchus agilis]
MSRKFGLMKVDKKKRQGVSSLNVFEDNDITGTVKSAESNARLSFRDTKYIEDAIQNTEKSRAPKYIEGLLKAHTEREIERERRYDRKIQRELDEECGQFADKEVFITNSYRKRLQKLEEEEEKRRKEAEIEELLDVKKQGNMNGFFRFMLNNIDRKGRNYRKMEAQVSDEEETSQDEKKDEGHGEEVCTSFDQISQSDTPKNVVDLQPELKTVEKPKIDLEKLRMRTRARDHELRALLRKKTVDKIFEQARERYIARELKRISVLQNEEN